MKTKKIYTADELSNLFMYQVTEEMIDNSNFGDLGKMYLKKKALNYKYTPVKQWCDNFNNQAGNIMVDIALRNELRNSTVTEAYFSTRFQLCGRYENDFEDCEELANMKLFDFWNLSHDEQYKYLWKIDTACRSQIYYAAEIAFKYDDNDVTTPFIDWIINFN